MNDRKNVTVTIANIPVEVADRVSAWGYSIGIPTLATAIRHLVMTHQLSQQPAERPTVESPAATDHPTDGTV